ncbi:NADH-quinone oxidoreductase subunit N [Marinobacterium jannaschii]|uniref:NADH-quinone oxidoreductase subunit N n=1 Tax=Marinobacterium jannaschii TaxID=64970 RepID=UPI0004829CAB|nr:NADH-quinone oxidoreductase subunit N [Marinobacterium jannaschii]
MSSDSLLSLLPLICISVTIMILMLQIVLVPGDRLSYWLTVIGVVATLWATFFITPLLPQQATILLTVDAEARLFSQILVICTLLLLPFCHRIPTARGSSAEYLLLLLLTLLGALVLASASHMAALVIGVELISLSLVVMIAYPFAPQYSTALETGIKYLLLSGVASAVLLFGAGLTYIGLGALEFSAISQAFTDIDLMEQGLVLSGLMMVIAAIGFKLSLAPFHLWTADLYQGAPLLSATVLATLAKAAMALALFRFYLAADLAVLQVINLGIALLAILSMLTGNLLALFQRDLRRIMAGSSIAHFGYLMVLLVAISTLHSVEGAAQSRALLAWVIYLVTYLAATLAVFSVMLHIAPASEAFHQTQLKGLCQRHPLSGWVLLLAMLSLAGIPLTAGFIGKFYIFTEAVNGTLWGLLLTLIAASAIGLFYYLKVVLMLISPAEGAEADPVTGRWLTRLPIILIALFIVFVGIYPPSLIDLLSQL